MTHLRWGRTLAVFSLMILLASGAVQALPLSGDWTAPAGLGLGIRGLLKQVLSYVWVVDETAADSQGAQANGDTGSQLDPDGATANGDNGSQLDPNG